MSTVQQRVRGQVGVKTWAMAINYVANEVFRVWLIILQQRGLANEHLLSQREVLNKGVFTWLLTRHLKRAILEVYQEGSSEAAERWDMIFTYADPNEEVRSEEEVDSIWETYLDEITPFMTRLSALPPGSVYRVVVDLHDEVAGQPPPEVEGWSSTTLRNANDLQKHDFGQIISGGGKIDVAMELLGHW